MKKPIKKVTICEDHQIVTDGLRILIDSFPGFEVSDTVTHHQQLLDSFEKQLPDILLLDLNLPGKNGIDILKDILGKYDFKILILTMYNKKSIVQKVFSTGGHGFLLKNCTSEDLYDGLLHVSSLKSFYYGEGVKREMKKEDLALKDAFYKSIRLTPREKEIVKHLCDGEKVPEIACSMSISPLTVETHKKNIYRKLGVDTSIKLVTFVHENQLL